MTQERKKGSMSNGREVFDFDHDGPAWLSQMLVFHAVESDIYLWRDLLVEAMKKFQLQCEGRMIAEMSGEEVSKETMDGIIFVLNIRRTKHLMGGGTVQTCDEQSTLNLEKITKQCLRHFFNEEQEDEQCKDS